MPCTHYTQCSFHSNEGPVQHRCVQQRLVQQVQCDPQGGLNSFGNRQEGLIHASRPTHSDLLNANYYLLNCTLHYFSHWRAIALDVSLLENCMTLAASIWGSVPGLASGLELQIVSINCSEQNTSYHHQTIQQSRGELFPWFQGIKASIFPSHGILKFWTELGREILS